jgi:MFS transporter, UMF1 family
MVKFYAVKIRIFIGSSNIQLLLAQILLIIFMQNETVQTTPIPKNNPYTIKGWAFFDWANSAYALVITVAIFPAYFSAHTPAEISIGQFKMANSTLFSWSISLAYLVIALLSPLLSGIADYGGKRKVFLRFFTLLGSLACISLLFFTSEKTMWIGVTGFILATIGFAGGIVFYNSFLPQIATEDQFDKVSAKGFSYGFVGSVILLVINLYIIQHPTMFGFSESGKAVPVAFVLVGLWWMGFAQIPLKRLPEDSDADLPQGIMSKGYAELKKVWQIVRRDSHVLGYLGSFFCFNAGVQTVLLLAAIFAEKVLGFNAEGLIYLILILQIVAIGGAELFARISGRIGNKRALAIMLVIWTGICITGYFVQTGLDFYLLAAAVGVVMGGTQSLSRSTYAKFIPENTPDTASYFSFYDVVDKISTVAGTFIFGVVEQLTGNMRMSVLSLVVFFVLSLILLRPVTIKVIQGK